MKKKSEEGLGARSEKERGRRDIGRERRYRSPMRSAYRQARCRPREWLRSNCAGTSCQFAHSSALTGLSLAEVRREKLGHPRDHLPSLRSPSSRLHAIRYHCLLVPLLRTGTVAAVRATQLSMCFCRCCFLPFTAVSSQFPSQQFRRTLSRSCALLCIRHHAATARTETCSCISAVPVRRKQ